MIISLHFYRGRMFYHEKDAQNSVTQVKLFIMVWNLYWKFKTATTVNLDVTVWLSSILDTPSKNYSVFLSLLKNVKSMIRGSDSRTMIWAMSSGFTLFAYSFSFFLNLNFCRFLRICPTPLFNTTDSSRIQSGRVYLRNLGMKGIILITSINLLKSTNSKVNYQTWSSIYINQFIKLHVTHSIDSF